MNYKVEDIEGIGPVNATILQQVGITDTVTLLARCGDRSGRNQIVAATGLSESRLLKWVNMADLMRISGVGSEFSELLEAAGVDTIKELRRRKAEYLAAMMEQINITRNLTRTVPSVTQVRTWIEQAKTLEPTISH